MPASDAPTRPLGTLRAETTHTGLYGTWYEDALEHVPDVTYPDSVPTYQRMRRDPTLSSILAGYVNPAVAAHWHLDPAGASDTAVRVVADSLGLPIDGDDPTAAGAARNRAAQWKTHVRLGFLKLVFGHIGFEPYYDLTSGRALLAGIPERMPYSIDRIHVDERTGDFLGVTQKNTSKAWPTDVPQIKADRLVWYTHQREGAAWAGQSLLRPAFAPWLLKWEALRIHPTALRRFGAGTPVMEPLQGTNPTPAQVLAAERAAANVRVGDSAGMATPGFKLRIVGVEGSIPDAMPLIRYLDEQMARSALFSLLDLGSTANGSRALGDNFADVLALALQAVADDLATEATLQLAAPIVTFNEGPGAAVPRIVVDDVAATEQALAATIATLIQAGALTHDPDLEAHLRRVFNLPAVGTPTPVPPGPRASARTRPAVRTPDKPAAAAGTNLVGGRIALTDGTDWPYHRPLTPTEIRAALDPRALDETERDLTAAAMAAWVAVKAAQVDDLEQQIEDAVAAGDLAALAALTVAVDAAARVLADAAAQAATDGAAIAAREAAEQGATVDLTTVQLPDLDPWAAGVAGILSSGLASSAGKEALRLASPGATGADVAAGVRTFLEGLTDAAVREAVGGVIQAGIGSGRTAVAAAVTAAGPVARFFHSAIRDNATCSPCEEADGVEYPSLAAAEAVFPTGGYTSCLGRYRCRCIVAVTYDDGATA